MKITTEEYNKALKTIQAYYLQIALEVKSVSSDINTLPKFIGITKEDMLINSGISIRAFNAIKSNYFDNLHTYDNISYKSYKDLDKLKVSCLEGMSRKELAYLRNFGKKSLDEVIELCLHTGIVLKP